jgi:hypothetical protein
VLLRCSTQTPEVANAVDNATTMTTMEVIGAVALLHADVQMHSCMHAPPGDCEGEGGRAPHTTFVLSSSAPTIRFLERSDARTGASTRVNT